MLFNRGKLLLLRPIITNSAKIRVSGDSYKTFRILRNKGRINMVKVVGLVWKIGIFKGMGALKQKRLFGVRYLVIRQKHILIHD